MHRELCSEELLKLIDNYTDEEIENRLRDVVPVKWDEIVSELEKTIVTNIKGR